VKRYPKIPRHDLEFVPEDLFNASDLVLLEKVDGMNFRFMMYEDRFRDEYDDIVLDTNPNDGDIIFGTKGVGTVRGRISQDISNFEPKLEPAVQALREIDTNPIREAQEEHGPLVWFAEHMVRHSLDYEYDFNPPPELIGFDVYSPRKDTRDELPENPYKEKFIGYLDIEDMQELFRSIGISTTPEVDYEPPFNPDSFDTPKSAFADVEAEGVVIRSDDMQLRSKYVREGFKELNKSSMGGYSKEENPDIWFVDVIVTPARIRSNIRKLTNNRGYEFSKDESFVDLVTRTVLVDGWGEEFSEIRDIRTRIKPSDIHEPAHRRVESVIERMHQTSASANANPTDLWSPPSNGTDDKDIKVVYEDIDVADTDKQIIEETKNQEDRERAIIEVLIGTESIADTVLKVSDKRNKDVKGWAVEPVVEKISDKLWANHSETLSHIHVEFNPRKLEDTITMMVREEIERIADVDLERGGEGWEPDNNMTTDGLDNIF
jgi:hypothetical protein